jgi:hypothetical protein
MKIRITKRADGGSVLSCTRNDGTVTWQRQRGKNAVFFPLHDLTHYAVESTLGHEAGFYGLVAEGWDIGDFGSPWPRGPMPDDALASELIVGFLDAERAGGVTWTAADLNEKAALYNAEHDRPPKWKALTDDDLTRVRSAARELIARWRALDPGEMIELQFDVASRHRRFG